MSDPRQSKVVCADRTRAAKMYEEFVAERRMLREALAEYGETDEKLAARYAALKAAPPFTEAADA